MKACHIEKPSFVCNPDRPGKVNREDLSLNLDLESSNYLSLFHLESRRFHCEYLLILQIHNDLFDASNQSA